MLTENGQIEFTAEIMDLIDRFLHEYQEKQGSPHNPLERGLVIAYALGVLSCQSDKVWEALSQDAVFGPVQPRHLFDECRAKDSDQAAVALARITEAMRQRGWISAEA